MLAKPGKSMLEAHFKEPPVPLEKPWSVAKGEWAVQDGAIVGKEKASDNHPAVLTLGLPARDSVIRFSFKLDGGKDFALSYNLKGAPLPHTHRRDSSRWRRIGTRRMRRAKREPARPRRNCLAGEWHTMLVEIKGDQASIQTDDGAKVAIKNPEIAVDKTGFRRVCHPRREAP